MAFSKFWLPAFVIAPIFTNLASADLSAAITVSGSAATSTYASTTIVATATDESGILVEETGTAYLTDVTVYKTGDTTSTDDSAFTDLNAAVAVDTEGTIYMYSCNITTNGEGANALHTHEDGSSAYLYDLYIYAEGEFSHGIYTAGGYIYSENMECYTYGTSSSAIATDSGGGTIVVSDSTAYTYGLKSALVYSTGNITATNLKGAADRSPACVIDGSNSWTLNSPEISSSPEEHGVFQTMSTVGGSSSSAEAYAYVTGGSVAETGGTYGLIFTSNADFYIYLDSVDVSISSGILANASADDWGTSGSNGGTIYASLTSMDISGDVYVDSISAVTVTLESTSWSGAINNDNTGGDAGVTLDADSTWTVTGDSYITTLVDDDTSCSNIVSDGYTVYYDSSANSWLDGETISLSGGGSLTPA